MNQLVAGILLKSGIVAFLPYPQRFNCGVAPHPTLNEIARTGGFLLLCDLCHGNIRGCIDLLSPYFLSQRRGAETGNLFRTQLLEQLFRERFGFRPGDETFLYLRRKTFSVEIS